MQNYNDSEIIYKNLAKYYEMRWYINKKNTVELLIHDMINEKNIFVWYLTLYFLILYTIKLTQINSKIKTRRKYDLFDLLKLFMIKFIKNIKIIKFSHNTIYKDIMYNIYVHYGSFLIMYKKYKSSEKLLQKALTFIK